FSADVRITMPVSGDIINEFSGTKPVKSKTLGDWRVHSGIDIKAPKGEAVCAPADGKIIEAYNSKLTGNTVSIEHDGGLVSTLYNLESIAVETGNKVKSGEKIGTVGTSAALESLEEPHVHFELKKEGKTVNPKDYIG
ncbi:MAG: M23 family metallopeptidase, partial [Clostridia bacterium]|nr:M23 family metallopeptidase [Clostridia bacterium]